MIKLAANRFSFRLQLIQGYHLSEVLCCQGGGLCNDTE